MTRADRILVFVIVCALPFLYARVWFDAGDARYLQVHTGDHEALTAALSPGRTLRIQGMLGESIIEIDNGHARFVSSPCTGQRCIQAGWLTSSGSSAACLPNRVSVTLLERHPRFDTINF